MKSIGDRLSELRQDNDLTQSKMAKIINISRAAVASYEANNTTPSLDVLVRYADYFDVSTDYILGRVKEKNFKIIEKNDIKVECKKEADETVIKEFIDMISNESLLNILKSQIK